MFATKVRRLMSRENLFVDKYGITYRKSQNSNLFIVNSLTIDRQSLDSYPFTDKIDHYLAGLEEPKKN